MRAETVSSADSLRKFLSVALIMLLQRPAGSGKTSLTFHLTDELLSRGVACIRITTETLRRRPELKKPHKFVADLCPVDVDDRLWHSRASKKHSKIVLLLDGLNEMHRELFGKPQWDFVLRLLEGNHRFPVLATTRYFLEDLDDSEREIVRLSLRPLTQSQISNYLESKGLNSATAIDEISAAGMEGAATNPFLLSLLAEHLEGVRNGHDSTQGWPKSRAQLLASHTSNHLRRKSTLNNTSVESGSLTHDAVFCAACLTTEALKKPLIPLGEMQALLTKVWDKPEDFIMTQKFSHDFLNLQLVEYHESTDSFRFIHDSLVDFGLAKASLVTDTASPPLFAFLLSQFDTLLGDWVGLHPDPDQAAKIVTELAMQYGCPDKLVDIAVANRGVLSENTHDELWYTIGNYLHIGSPRSIASRVVDRLSDLPPRLVNEALRHKLLRAVERSNAWLGKRILNALTRGSLSSQAVASWKREYARLYRKNNLPAPNKKKHTTVRRQENLEKTDKALKVIEDPLMPENKRRWAIMELSQNSTESICTLLKNVVLEDRHPPVRGAAANVLGQIGDRSAVKALSEVLFDSSTTDWVRGSAANALGQIGARSAVETLSKTLLDSGTKEGIRGSAATALGQIGDRSAVEALNKALLDSDARENIRGSAATALGQIGDRSAVEALSKALLDSDAREDIRGSAANALGQIGDRSAVEVLSKALTEDSDSGVRGSAASALGQIGDRSAVEALSKTLLDSGTKEGIRGSAATALGQIGDRSAVEALNKALLDSDARENIRGSAATALGQIGDRSAVEALSKALLDSDAREDIRGSAANALGQIGDRSAVEALSKALLDSDARENIRGSAANALGQIGDRSAVRTLGKALFDPSSTTNSRMIITAIRALQKIRSHTASQYLYDFGKQNALNHKLLFPTVDAYAHIMGAVDPWIRTLARAKNNRLRGKVIQLIATYGQTPEDWEQLNWTARYDYDYGCRTEAVRGLSRVHKLDDSLIRYLIDPDFKRKDGRLRDTDNGVRGQVAAEIILLACSSSLLSDEHLRLAVEMLADTNSTHKSVIYAALSPITRQTAESALQILKLIRSLTPNNADERFLSALEQYELRANYLQQQENALSKLHHEPQFWLEALRDTAIPHFNKLSKVDQMNTKSDESGNLDPIDDHYEIALSYASEQRDYVKRVAAELEKAGVKLFYDEFADLWGEDLTTKLAWVYGKGSKYIVVFVSQEYISKSWTNHEREHMLAGRINRQDRSVLPIKFDEVELPGLANSISYLKAANHTPKEIAEKIIRKL